MEEQRNFIPLENIRIAAPCRADWNKMQGDERVRFCHTCAKNVYNLRAMSRSEAEELIREKEGNLCLRLHKRTDGTVLTADCPVGLKVLHRPFKWLAVGIVALFGSGVAIIHNEAVKASATGASHLRLRDVQPFKLLYDWADPETIVLVGDVATPPDMPKPIER